MSKKYVAENIIKKDSKKLLQDILNKNITLEEFKKYFLNSSQYEDLVIGVFNNRYIKPCTVFKEEKEMNKILTKEHSVTLVEVDGYDTCSLFATVRDSLYSMYFPEVYWNEEFEKNVGKIYVYNIEDLFYVA